MIREYPTAGLITDYRLGMADHVNAVKAMILFLDIHALIIEQGVGSSMPEGGVTGIMLAGAYNGGPSRVIRSIKEMGSRWESSELIHPETRQYLDKYRSISALKIFP